MSTNKKPTIVENFKDIIEVLEANGLLTAERKAFLEKRIEVTEKKNASGSGADRKPTKTQLENEGIKEQILEFLRSVEKPVTNGEITKGIGSYQPNKICQLVAQMLTVRKGVENPDGCIVRTEVKGKAYFALADKVEE